MRRSFFFGINYLVWRSSLSLRLSRLQKTEIAPSSYWELEKEERLKTFLELANGILSVDPFERLFDSSDPVAFHHRIGDHYSELLEEIIDSQ